MAMQSDLYRNINTINTIIFVSLGSCFRLDHRPHNRPVGEPVAQDRGSSNSAKRRFNRSNRSQLQGALFPDSASFIPLQVTTCYAVQSQLNPTDASAAAAGRRPKAGDARPRSELLDTGIL
jgi:hypothetical protein